MLSSTLAFALLATCLGVPLHDLSDVPTQVHIAQSTATGCCGVAVTWITDQDADGTVEYGTNAQSLTSVAKQTEEAKSYTFVSAYTPPGPYTSGLIHHVELADLKPSTRYFYRCGGKSKSKTFSFETPPKPDPNAPFTFALIGDLGQTNNSQATIDHIMSDASMKMTMIVGDLSYADSAWDPTREKKPCTQTRWDSWGRMVEPIFANMPMMALPGNHEQEQDGPAPATQTQFLAFQERFRMPGKASGATNGNLYFSFEVAGAHIIHLNSYMPFNETSDQYHWLLSDLKKVDRSKTPWLIVNMHAPWYNSNQHHHNEVEEYGMKNAMEDVFHTNHVDVVFAGHVHAYERMYPVYKNKTTEGAVTYINIGDGGNREGPCPEYFAQPSWSAYREAAFGHGRFEIFNSTHSHWEWHKITQPESQIGDNIWLVRKNGVTGVRTVPVGRSDAQYDGYAYMLNK